MSKTTGNAWYAGWRQAIAAIALCLCGCAIARGADRREPATSIVSGTMRVAGDIVDDFPCTVLKPILAATLEYGVDTCNAVPLTFTARGGRAEAVFDLWVVTGNASIAAGAESDVVDFYERVSLGEVGDTACGRFELKRYVVAGRTITVLANQTVERTCRHG